MQCGGAAKNAPHSLHLRNMKQCHSDGSGQRCALRAARLSGPAARAGRTSHTDEAGVGLLVVQDVARRIAEKSADEGK